MRQITIGSTPVSALCLGAMWFGSRTDEATSVAILDRYFEAGGRFLDTADSYAFWIDGGTGDESESLLGRWLAARGVRDEMVVATKVGARPAAEGKGEGLSAKAVRRGVEGSLRRLGTGRIDLLYTHVEDRSVPLEDTVGELGNLVGEGVVGRAGCSNHPAWRIERARTIARGQGWAGYQAVQQRYSYLRPLRGTTFAGGQGLHVSDELLDYVATEDDLTLLAYSPLLGGAYTRADKPLPAGYDHPGTAARLAALSEVAAELGATAYQVVLAWLFAAGIVPVIGVSSVAQLDDCLGALDVTLDPDQRARLDAA